jgi:hypothetical protein
MSRRRNGGHKVIAWVFSCDGVREVYRLDERGNRIDRRPSRPAPPAPRPLPAVACAQADVKLGSSSFDENMQWPDYAYAKDVDLPDTFAVDAFEPLSETSPQSNGLDEATFPTTEFFEWPFWDE